MYNSIKTESASLETHFAPFREGIIGQAQTLQTPYGVKKLCYADWIAGGRLYRPIERCLAEQIGPYVSNTHTETSATGRLMTAAYREARRFIKEQVNAGPQDVLIVTGSGMTGAINKFQRILGLRLPERMRSAQLVQGDNPVVFVTHMEHHSNHTSWLETTADVVLIASDEQGLVDLVDLEEKLLQYADRRVKIASVSGGSNVTGIIPPYHQIAKLMHQHGGLCFVDFACSAPYIDIDMHPEDPSEALDAIFFSPHKFLGGPGSPGVLIFNAALYDCKIPDVCGGGTVTWTNPWGQRAYLDDIELREDGGTPPFMQTLRAALSIRLKEEMGVANISKREHQLLEQVFEKLDCILNLHILAGDRRERLGVISFYIEDLHYNLGVRMLSDRFGIQTRGGCSCAGTYGHYLLHVDPKRSNHITTQIDQGDLAEKPGWIRLSLHPTMTTQEVETITEALAALAQNHPQWERDYERIPRTNDYRHKSGWTLSQDFVKQLFM